MSGFVVHKHPLVIDRDNHVRVPWGTSFIHFDFQDRTPTVWSLKPTDVTYRGWRKGVTEQRGWMECTLRIVGTGHEAALTGTDLVPPTHLGTAIIDWFVFHCFVVGIKEVEHG